VLPSVANFWRIVITVQNLKEYEKARLKNLAGKN
jgi:hypothetical protein